MKTDRLVGIIMVLLEKERVGAQELADLFEVSPRTIYRDIDTIGLAGIPVRAAPGVGGGFEILPKYKVDKTVFSSADLSAILLGLSGLRGMMRGEELAHALAKVKSCIPAGSAKEIEVKANQICIDVSPWMGNRDLQPYLKSIQTALQESKLLVFDYTGRQGNKTARTVEPYQLVLKSSHWYLQGYCRERRDFRLFKLSRMEKLQMQAETFPLREHTKPILDFAEMAKDLQTDIQLRVHQSLVERILDFCTHDCFTPDGDKHYIVRFPFMENDYNYNILLGFGDKCECLGPLSVREEMKRRSQAIASLYQE